MAIAMVDAIEPIKQSHGRPRKRPDAVYADRAYDFDKKIRRPLRQRGITPLIARRNTDHGSGLGTVRWVVEAAFAWLFKRRRLRVRYEKRDDIHQAFLSLGCLLICWHRIAAFC
jgi:transposase